MAPNGAGPIPGGQGLRVLIAALGKRRARRSDRPSRARSELSLEFGAERGEEALGRCMVHGGRIPPVSPTLFPVLGEECLPALVSVEAEASLEVSADLGHLPVLSKVVAQPPAMGPSGRSPKRLSHAQPLCDP